MKKERDEQFYLEPVKKITRVAVKKIDKDELYKEYLNLFEIVNILQERYSEILKLEFKEASENAKLKDKVEELETEIKGINEQIKLYMDAAEIERKERDNYLQKYLDVKDNNRVKNERGAGRKRKFNDVQVEQIKELRAQGISIKNIANEFGCSVGLIHKILSDEQYPKVKENKPYKTRELKDYSIQDLKNLISLKKHTIEALNIPEDSDQYKDYLKVVQELERRENIENS